MFTMTINDILKGGLYDKFGFRETKTKVKHHIPLAAEMEKPRVVAQKNP